MGVHTRKEEEIEDIIRFRDFFRIFLKVMYALRKILVGLISFIFLTGIIIAYTDGLPSWWDGIYLAFVSAFTVGYGDITPITRISKFICVALLPPTGMLLTGIIVAGALRAIEIGNQEMKERRES